MEKRFFGEQSIRFERKPYLAAAASVVGPKEGAGPLGGSFDRVLDDAKWGQDSFEQAERAMFREACEMCVRKAHADLRDVRCLLGGDLTNQIMAASLAARELELPFFGLYGACSTLTESLLMGAMLVDGGYADRVVCAAGSHFCTAERQYRFPLEYGNQRPPAAQWTVTGAGAYLLAEEGEGPRVTMGTVGRVVDLGVTDANNMGAAMAPAAADTLLKHFADTGRSPADYDCIVTGDLGEVGSHILYELLSHSKVTLNEKKHMDCGRIIFDTSQDVHAGGSGCGCIASVLGAALLPKLASGAWRRAAVMATGALLSPTTSQQGESIPGVAHLIVLEGKETC